MLLSTCQGMSKWRGCPLWTPSATARSSPSNTQTNSLKAIFKSGHSPHGKGPLTHTVHPVCIEVPTSCLKPGPQCFSVNHLPLKERGSQMRKSVSSTVILHLIPLSLTSWFSHSNFHHWLSWLSVNGGSVAIVIIRRSDIVERSQSIAGSVTCD